MGFRWIIEIVSRRTKTILPIAAMLLLFPIVSAFMNYEVANASNDYSVEYYTQDILSNLPRNSLVLSFQWDNFVSASLYYQNVDKLRTDIIVIDKELLRRSWYASQVHNRYAFIFPANDPTYNSYMENLRLFENDLPYDPASIELQLLQFYPGDNFRRDEKRERSFCWAGIGRPVSVWLQQSSLWLTLRTENRHGLCVLSLLLD